MHRIKCGVIVVQYVYNSAMGLCVFDCHLVKGNRALQLVQLKNRRGSGKNRD